MAEEMITVNGNKMIQAIGEHHWGEILDCMGIDLRTATPKHLEQAEWHEDREDKWWKIEAKQMDLTDDYAVRWTSTEAGPDDIEIVKRFVNEIDDVAALHEYLNGIAEDLGDGQVQFEL